MSTFPCPWCGVESAHTPPLDLSVDKATGTVSFGEGTRGLIRQVLGEALGGAYATRFENDRAVLELLRGDVAAGRAVALSDVGTLYRTIDNLVYEVVPAWEFHTVLGYWPREVDAVARELRRLCDAEAL